MRAPTTTHEDATLKVLTAGLLLGVRWSDIPRFDSLQRFRTLQSLYLTRLAPRKAIVVSVSNATGERGSVPYLVFYHDISHVLAGYGTDPASEVQAGCFQGGYQHSDGFMLVFFVLCQFHLGIRMTPIARAELGMVDPFRALDAVCRGAGMSRDLTDGTWDPWAHMGEDVEALRSRYHLVPPAWPPTAVKLAA